MTLRRIGVASLLRQLGQWYQQTSRTPVWQQLSDSLRLLILDGRLPIGSKLPGERDLAAALQISRTTVTSAFTRLRDEGFLLSKQGSGSTIMLPEQSRIPTLTSSIAAIDLSTAALSAGPEINHAYQSVIEELPAFMHSTGYDPVGIEPLREAIACRYTQRGLPTRADNIMVVNGAVSGLALLLRLLTGPGDRVVVDHPTYPLAISAIRAASCRPVAVSLPENGWDVDGLAATIARTAPRLAWLLPDFHNPTGRCMDAATRAEVAAIAARTQTIIVVDETMVDLWFDAPPPPPLAVWDQNDRVITLGSAGKSFWGGLRLGWIRASTSMIASLVQARESLDLGTPLPEQLAATWLTEQSATFLPQKRDILRNQRDAAIAAMQRYFPQWKTTTPAGGLSMWVELPLSLASTFAAASENIGIHIGAGPRFGTDGAFERFLRLPFTLEPALFDNTLARLQPVWESVSQQRSRRVNPVRGYVV